MHSCRWLLIGSFLVLPCGCGGPPVEEVRGSVLLDDKPLAGAQLSFCSTKDHALGVNNATTGADGSFELTSSPLTGEMLKPGKYVVLVEKSSLKDGLVDEAMELRPLLPEKYRFPDQCPFTVEIKPGVNDLPPFRLESR